MLLMFLAAIQKASLPTSYSASHTEIIRRSLTFSYNSEGENIINKDMFKMLTSFT